MILSQLEANCSSQYIFKRNAQGILADMLLIACVCPVLSDLALSKNEEYLLPLSVPVFLQSHLFVRKWFSLHTAVWKDLH